jgi:hypothetical protein
MDKLNSDELRQLIEEFEKRISDLEDCLQADSDVSRATQECMMDRSHKADFVRRLFKLMETNVC